MGGRAGPATVFTEAGQTARSESAPRSASQTSAAFPLSWAVWHYALCRLSRRVHQLWPGAACCSAGAGRVRLRRRLRLLLTDALPSLIDNFCFTRVRKPPAYTWCLAGFALERLMRSAAETAALQAAALASFVRDSQATQKGGNEQKRCRPFQFLPDAAVSQGN